MSMSIDQFINRLAELDLNDGHAARLVAIGIRHLANSNGAYRERAKVLEGAFGEDKSDLEEVLSWFDGVESAP